MGIIKKKEGFCPECNDGVLKVLVKGLCYHHYWRPRKKNLTRKVGLKRTKLILPSPIEVMGPTELQQWYDNQMKKLTGYCQECGDKYNKWYYRAAIASIAHILPKEIFDSIKMNDDNWLELGAECGCHQKWDKNWQTASQMKIFPDALQKFALFEYLIAPEERHRIPLIFLHEPQRTNDTICDL